MFNNEYIKVLFELIKNQGLSFLLLGTMTYYFYDNLAILQSEIKVLNTEIRECDKKILEVYKNDHMELRKLLIEHKRVMEKIINKIDNTQK
jgi:hypothetical protein